MKKYSWLLLLILIHSASEALPGIITLTNESEQYHISDAIEYYPDSLENITIEQISSPTFSGKFLSGRIPYSERNYDKSYWIRFTVHNQRDLENQVWYFESWGFDIDHIEFYVPDRKGAFFKTSMGYSEDFSRRNIFHKNLQFLINLNSNEKATYYIRLKRSYPMHLTFFIRTHEAFIKHMVHEYWYLGIFYGIFAFIILINLYLFLTLKESIYFYYILLASSEVLYCLGRDGLGFQFLWPSQPWFNTFTHHNYIQFFFILCTLLYSIKFLKLKSEQPNMYRLTIAAMVTKALMFGLFIFYPIEAFYVFSIDSFLLCIPFASGILSIKKGNRYAKYYVAAFTFLFISFLLIFMEERRLLPFIVINWYFINIGMLLEVIFLAIALIDQIKVLRKQNEEAHRVIISELREKEQLKDRINEELEYTVMERTREIKKVLHTLEDKNKELSKANAELNFLTEEIKRMNELLNQDNQKLKTNITEISQSRILLKDVRFEEFRQTFPDDDSCLKYIADLKWKNGYRCRKCGFNKGVGSNKGFSIRCRNCKYNESPTSGTLFHKLKFPVNKAFYMMYLITSKDNTHTLDELSSLLSLRRETCWSFRNKVMTIKEKYSKKELLTEEAGWASLILTPGVEEKP